METLRYVSSILYEPEMKKKFKLPEVSAGCVKTTNLRFNEKPRDAKRIVLEALKDTPILRDLLEAHKGRMSPNYSKLVVEQRDVSSLLTVIVSTSATQSNPSTLLPELVLSSFYDNAPCLCKCRKIIVCDGYRKPRKGTNRNEFRQGYLTDDAAHRYEEYIQRLTAMAHEEIEPIGRNAKVLVMPERRGFGYALKAALYFVKTPYVIVVQHDRMFSRIVNIPAVLDAMIRDPEKLKCVVVLYFLSLSLFSKLTSLYQLLRYVHFPTCISQRYLNELKNQEFTGTNDWMKDLYLDIQRQTIHDKKIGSFVPMMHWYDSIHIASTKHYSDFVFGYDYAYQRMRVKFGSFPEDKVGQQLRDDVKVHGIKAHAAYGTFVFEDGMSNVSVQHIDGRSFYSLARRKQIKEQFGEFAQLSEFNYVVLSRLAGLRGTTVVSK